MSSERYIPNYDFEPGELMSWQEMSRLLREAIPQTWDTIMAIQAQVSDIKTRLDDLEEKMGDLQVQHDDIGAITGISIQLTPEMPYMEEVPGTHPSNCRCAWCESGDGSAWGS